MLKNQDLISVIMAVYNCEDYVTQSIESILNQTYKNFEFIICDDCSTDNTYNIVKKYQEKFPDKIILIKNQENSKLSYSLNHCLQYAKGEFIARMDGDDISAPDRFEKQIKYLKEHPDIDLVGTYMQRFDNEEMADIVKVPLNPNKFTLRKQTPFFHATILTYKKVYDELEGYTVSERTVRAQDYDLWFRFYHKGFKGENIPESLYLVRENLAAIKRRTFRVRWNAFKTTRIGFKLLNYPKWWIIKPAVQMICKSITPVWFVCFYRWLQSKINK